MSCSITLRSVASRPRLFSSMSLEVRRLELAHRDLAVLGLDHDAVAAADCGIGRDDQDGALPVGRLQRTAGDLDRVDVLVVDVREGQLLPVLADRNSGVVECAARLGGAAHLGQSDARDRLRQDMAAFADQLHEHVEAGLGGGQRAGGRRGVVRGPAFAPQRSDTLRLVEGRLGRGPGRLGKPPRARARRGRPVGRGRSRAGRG